MKIESIHAKDYLITFIKKELSKEDIKNLLQRIQLQGFYKVEVIIKPFGCFLRVLFIESSFYKNHLDLKIEYKDENVYYCTEDYEAISSFSSVLFYHGKYYALMNDSNEVLSKVEFGCFVLEKEIEDVLKSGCIVK